MLGGLARWGLLGDDVVDEGGEGGDGSDGSER